MDDKNDFFSPQLFESIYKIFGIILLCVLWILTDGTMVGLFFMLTLVILILLRWRFKKLTWTLAFDFILCLIIPIYWTNGIYALGLPIFECAYHRLSWLSLPAILYPLFYGRNDSLYAVLLQSFFIGLVLRYWHSQHNRNLMKLNQSYKKRHALESLKDDLLIANVQVAKMAELSERGRIARELHDHAGHDIIAAYMSLQVIEDLIETDPENAKKIYTEAMKRLQMGIQKVRDTAHNLTPLTNIGLDYFESLCEDFNHCPMELKVYGDTSKVPIYLWSILEPCLKEGLSNILRHSQATKVTVVLDITPYIVRLSIENDGINILSNGKQSPYGMGLRNLRYRAKTVGGNISIDVSQTFKLICVLPLTQNV